MGHKYYLAVILGILLLHSVNNIVILRQDTVYPYAMESVTYTYAIRFYLALREGSWWEKLTLFFIGPGPACPPLFPSLGGLSMMLFGISADTATLAHLLFFAILLISTYLLGARLFNEETGLIAAVLLSFFPATFARSRVFTSDFALAAMVTLTVLLMARQDWSAFTAANVAAWMSLAAAALTKTTFSLFLVGPIASILLNQPAVRHAWETRSALPLRKVALNLVAGALIVIALAGPWYAAQGKEFLSYYYGPNTNRFSLTAAPLAIMQSWKILKMQVLPPMAVISLLSGIYLALIVRKHRMLLLSWMTVPVLYFALIPPNSHFSLFRNLMPALPALALCLGVLIWDLLRLLRTALRIDLGRIFCFAMGIILCVEIPLYFTISYAPMGRVGDPFGKASPPEYLLDTTMGRTAPFSSGINDSSMREAVLMLGREFSSFQEPPNVFFLNQNGLVSAMLQNELRRDAILNRYEFVESVAWMNLLPEDVRLDIEKFQEADYAVVECYNFGAMGLSPEGPWLEAARPLSEHIAGSLANYTLLFTFPNRFQRVQAEQCSWMNLNHSVLVLKKLPSLLTSRGG